MSIKGGGDADGQGLAVDLSKQLGFIFGHRPEVGFVNTNADKQKTVTSQTYATLFNNMPTIHFYKEQNTTHGNKQ